MSPLGPPLAQSPGTGGALRLAGALTVAGTLSWACGGNGERPSSDPIAGGDAGAAGSDAGAGGQGAGAGGGGGGWVAPDVELPPADFEGEFYLSELGLYADIENKLLAPDILEFEPNFVLWSDGAEKLRFLRLPPETTLDTSDMDHWLLPVGTQAFKQFSRDDKRVETRLIARIGEGRFDYWMGAFIWNDDESDAVFVPEGRDDARGTEHDVPSVKQCGTCHNGARGRYLGLSALQLFGGPTFEMLSERDLLSVPPPQNSVYEPPGNADAKAALGYLHANCGHCHNPLGTSWPDTDMVLRLSVNESELEETALYQTTVNVEPQSFMDAEYPARIAPGDPGASALLFRMQQRARQTQMPPIATELVDESGIQLIEGFIRELGSGR